MWWIPFLVLFILSPSWAQDSAEELAKQALAARESGQTERSVELYRLALALDSGNTEGWWYQGLNYYDLDRYEECEDAFLKVTEQMPQNGGAFAFLGLCETQNNKYKTAFAHLVLAQQKGIPPGTELETIVRYHYIALANKIGQFELSAGLLNEIVSHPQRDIPNLVELAGLSALRLKYLPEEIPEDKKEPVMLAGRATVLAWRKRLPEAFKESGTLLEKYPRQSNAHYLRAYLLLQEHSEDAIAEFEKELEITPDHVQARLQIAYEYLQRGQAPKGLPYAEKAVLLAPSDFTAHNIYGRLLLDAGKLDIAVSHLQTAVTLAPTSPEAHFHLSAALNRAGRKEEAERHRKLFLDLKAEREKQQGGTLPEQPQR